MAVSETAATSWPTTQRNLFILRTLISLPPNLSRSLVRSLVYPHVLACGLCAGLGTTTTRRPVGSSHLGPHHGRREVERRHWAGSSTPRCRPPGDGPSAARHGAPGTQGQGGTPPPLRRNKWKPSDLGPLTGLRHRGVAQVPTVAGSGTATEHRYCVSLVFRPTQVGAGLPTPSRKTACTSLRFGPGAAGGRGGSERLSCPRQNLLCLPDDTALMGSD